MYEKYEQYSKEEIMKSLIEYIRHVGNQEGTSFLCSPYQNDFEPTTWEILTKANEDSNDYDFS